MYRHMIWDFDGTLFDSYPAMSNALQEALKRYGYVEEEREILALMKISIGRAFDAYKAKYGLDDSLLAAYKEIAETAPLEKIRPYPGIPELLKTCAKSGCSHYVFTHRGPTTTEYLEAYGLLPLFREIVTSRSGFQKKPDPEAILYLLNKYSIDPAEAIMIGDRGIDVESGHNAGIHSCLFDPGGLAGGKTAQYYARTVEELEEIVAL